MREFFIYSGLFVLAVFIAILVLRRYMPDGSILNTGEHRARQGYAEFDRQHHAGWRVLIDGESVAELDHHHYEDSSFLFSLKLMVEDRGRIDELFRDTEREPDPRIVFENREFDVRVPDESFAFRIWDDGTASIRDFRVPLAAGLEPLRSSKSDPIQRTDV